MCNRSLFRFVFLGAFFLAIVGSAESHDAGEKSDSGRYTAFDTYKKMNVRVVFQNGDKVTDACVTWSRRGGAHEVDPWEPVPSGKDTYLILVDLKKIKKVAEENGASAQLEAIKHVTNQLDRIRQANLHSKIDEIDFLGHGDTARIVDGPELKHVNLVDGSFDPKIVEEFSKWKKFFHPDAKGFTFVCAK